MTIKLTNSVAIYTVGTVQQTDKGFIVPEGSGVAFSFPNLASFYIDGKEYVPFPDENEEGWGFINVDLGSLDIRYAVSSTPGSLGIMIENVPGKRETFPLK